MDTENPKQNYSSKEDDDVDRSSFSSISECAKERESWQASASLIGGGAGKSWVLIRNPQADNSAEESRTINLPEVQCWQKENAERDDKKTKATNGDTPGRIGPGREHNLEESAQEGSLEGQGGKPILGKESHDSMSFEDSEQPTISLNEIGETPQQLVRRGLPDTSALEAHEVTKQAEKNILASTVVHQSPPTKTKSPLEKLLEKQHSPQVDDSTVTSIELPRMKYYRSAPTATWHPTRPLQSNKHLTLTPSSEVTHSANSEAQDVRDGLTSLGVLFQDSMSSLKSDTSVSNLFSVRANRALSLPLKRARAAEEKDNATQYGTAKSITRMQGFVIQDARPADSDYFAPFQETNRNTLKSLISIPESQSQRSMDGLSRDRESKPESLRSKMDLVPSPTSGVAKVIPMFRNKKKKRRRRKWEKRDIARLERRYDKISNNRNNYYTNFWNSVGRTNPYRGMVVLIAWTTLFVSFDKSYFNVGGFEISLGLSSRSVHQLLGIALGFLLYMQATVSSTRWWRGRIEWQMIMENNKRLTILLNTHLNCLHLSKFGTKMIIAHIVCVLNFLNDKCEDAWHTELREYLDERTRLRIMTNSRRLRPLAVLYGFQRIIELCIVYRILAREVVRDINPILVSLSASFDACNRSRLTQLPWIMAVHLNFVVVAFLAILPLTLIRDPNEASGEGTYLMTRVTSPGVYCYVIVIGYAFFGLYQMAIDIEDPFSYKKESKSYGLWGLYDYWAAQEINWVRWIFRLRVVMDDKGKMTSKGDFGDGWSAKRLAEPIKRALTKGLFERDQAQVIKQNLKVEEERDYVFFDHKRENSDSSFCLSSDNNDNPSDESEKNLHQSEENLEQSRKSFDKVMSPPVLSGPFSASSPPFQTLTGMTTETLSGLSGQLDLSPLSDQFSQNP